MFITPPGVFALQSVMSPLQGRRDLKQVCCLLMCVFQQEGREAALRLVLEAQVREEVSAEFMELFKKMEKDYR